MTTIGAGAAISASSRADRLIFAGLAVALVASPIVFLPQLYDDFTLLKQVTLLLAAALAFAGLALQGFPICASRPVRIALFAWAAALLVSELFAIDPRGSALGVYQYRQGFLTQICYVLLFAGGLRLAAVGLANYLWQFFLVGFAGVAFYTAVQAVGADPVDWWTNTADRAIGTIGNANELAAFAVVSLVCFAWLSTREGKARLLSVAFAASASFIVLEAESRSGLGALALFLLLVPLSWWVARNPWRALLRPGATLIAGFIVGATLSFAAGGLTDTASRARSGVAGADTSASTRMALWRGTLEVIRSTPSHGAGPDGLYLAFPLHRPPGLGGAFEDYDLVAQSSHNLALDVAANYGIPGLAALAALLALSSSASVRRVRSRAERQVPSTEPWIWAALASYGALTLLNPVSLAPHAVFFVALGSLAGAKQLSARPADALAPALRLVAVAPVLFAVLFLAARLTLADLRANEAWDAYAAGNFDSAAVRYRQASSLMPLERRYTAQFAQSLLAAGVDGSPSRLQEADKAFLALDDKFGFTAGDAIGQATARLGLGRDESAVIPLVDRALRLNPTGAYMERYTNRLRVAAKHGAILHYSQRDRWVYVEPKLPPESTILEP